MTTYKRPAPDWLRSVVDGDAYKAEQEARNRLAERMLAAIPQRPRRPIDTTPRIGRTLCYCAGCGRVRWWGIGPCSTCRQP
jgi:hypothetical protein